MLRIFGLNLSQPFTFGASGSGLLPLLCQNQCPWIFSYIVLSCHPSSPVDDKNLFPSFCLIQRFLSVSLYRNRTGMVPTEPWCTISKTICSFIPPSPREQSLGVGEKAQNYAGSKTTQNWRRNAGINGQGKIKKHEELKKKNWRKKFKEMF